MSGDLATEVSKFWSGRRKVRASALTLTGLAEHVKRLTVDEMVDWRIIFIGPAANAAQRPPWVFDSAIHRKPQRGFVGRRVAQRNPCRVDIAGRHLPKRAYAVPVGQAFQPDMLYSSSSA